MKRKEKRFFLCLREISRSLQNFARHPVHGNIVGSALMLNRTVPSHSRIDVAAAFRGTSFVRRLSPHSRLHSLKCGWNYRRDVRSDGTNLVQRQVRSIDLRAEIEIRRRRRQPSSMRERRLRNSMRTTVPRSERRITWANNRLPLPPYRGWCIWRRPYRWPTTAYPGTCLEIILRIPSFRERARRRPHVEHWYKLHSYEATWCYFTLLILLYRILIFPFSLALSVWLVCFPI